MERVLVICGGMHQIPLIQKVKELGYQVLNTNLYENSPAFAYADKTGVMNVLDIEKNLQFAKEHNVTSVISDQSEISVRTVASVAEQMGLKSISNSMAELYTNKFLMREFCKQNNFVYPQYKCCKTLQEAIDFFTQCNCKMILKPLSSNSSQGVFSISSVRELEKRFDESLKYATDDKSLILEEYIEGTEFTIDTIVLDGEVFNLAISEKKHFEYNENVANELYFSYFSKEFDYEELRTLNKKIIETSGLSFGLTHSEFKFCKGKFYLIEMAARGGGAYIASKIVPYISGVDNYKWYIEASLGHDLSEAKMLIRKQIETCKKREAKLKFFDFKQYGKKIKKISGVDKLERSPNVIKISLAIKEDDILYAATDDSNRQGFYIISAESYKELEEVEKYVLDNIKIEFYE